MPENPKIATEAYLTQSQSWRRVTIILATTMMLFLFSYAGTILTRNATFAKLDEQNKSQTQLLQILEHQDCNNRMALQTLINQLVTQQLIEPINILGDCK